MPLTKETDKTPKKERVADHSLPHVITSAEPLQFYNMSEGKTTTIYPQKGKEAFVYVFPPELDDQPRLLQRLSTIATILDTLGIDFCWLSINVQVFEGRNQAFVVGRKINKEGQFVPFDFDKAVCTAVQIERVIKQLTDTDQIIEEAKEKIAEINDRD